jgi:tetratricopeptide (TPR) repeat protein
MAFSPLWWGFLACALYGADLPELPRVDTTGFLPVIRTQIEESAAAAKAHPQDPKALGMLAMTLHAYNQYTAAAPVYLRAHLLDPQKFDWIYFLAAVEMAQGQFDAAAESFRAALRIRPDDPVTELRLADCLAALARWDEAGAHYHRVLEKKPDDARAWYGLGRVQTAKRQHAAALESYVKACEIFPAFGAAHFAMAGDLRLLGKKAEMGQHLAAYSRNATVEPQVEDPLLRRIHDLDLGTQSHLQRAVELEKVGLLQEAAAENEAALAADPRNVQAHINLISLHARMGDPVKAQQQFEAAITLDPGRSDAWYNDGVLLFQQQNYAGAERAYRKALDINPAYAEAHNNLGAIYERLDRLADAANEFRSAIADRPDYPQARFSLGRLLVNERRYGEAIQQFLRALSPEDKQTTVYLYALAATYARAGDREHALAYFQKAHDAAATHGQSELLASIDRDFQTLR